jgi:rhomboid family GlyGly-CTERM serine protease
MKSVRPVLLLAALPAILLWLAPAAHPGLLYERTAILQGEWWRLWSGHWVHFSASHLGWNLAVLLGAGAWLERLQPGWLWRYILAGAPLVSAILILGEPAMQTYGGLSGLATGVVMLLALVQLGRNSRDRLWWAGVIGLIALKLGFDATHPAPLFSRFGSPTVRVSVLAHVAGAATALAFFLSRAGRFCLPLRRDVHPASPPSSIVR